MRTIRIGLTRACVCGIFSRCFARWFKRWILFLSDTRRVRASLSTWRSMKLPVLLSALSCLVANHTGLSAEHEHVLRASLCVKEAVVSLRTCRMLRKCLSCVHCRASHTLSTQPNALYVTVDSDMHMHGGVRFKADTPVCAMFSVVRRRFIAVPVSVVSRFACTFGEHVQMVMVL